MLSAKSAGASLTDRSSPSSEAQEARLGRSAIEVSQTDEDVTPSRAVAAAGADLAAGIDAKAIIGFTAKRVEGRADRSARKSRCHTAYRLFDLQAFLLGRFPIRCGALPTTQHEPGRSS